MHIIGFSHHYKKLQGQTHGTLIAVNRVTIDEHFPMLGLCYDTKYETIGEFGIHLGRQHGYDYARLKNGEYLQIVFIGNLQIPFTTYRNIPKDYAPLKDKPHYYRKSVPYSDLIGQSFAFKFKGEKLPKSIYDPKKYNPKDCVKIFN